MTHREYFYTLDAEGNLIHDGAILDDPMFLDLFFRRLRGNDSGRHEDYRYYAPCGPEWNYTAVADTPVVFTSFDGEHLGYAGSLRVPFSPSDLRFGDNGVLYHASPISPLGRLHRKVTLEVAKCVEPWGPWYAYTHPATGRIDVIRPVQVDPRYLLLPPRDGNACAGCGEDNPFGLRLSFLYDSQERAAHTWLRPTIRLMGSLNVMHGGYVALLLDETMGKVVRGCGVKAPTVQLNVRYRHPVPIGEAIHVRATLERVDGRKNMLRAFITRVNEESCVLAECEALFLTVPGTMQSRDESSMEKS
ncbi:MAG: DUF4505 family protein [Candidatus Kapaibacterium sp.]